LRRICCCCSSLIPSTGSTALAVGPLRLLPPFLCEFSFSLPCRLYGCLIYGWHLRASKVSRLQRECAWMEPAFERMISRSCCAASSLDATNLPLESPGFTSCNRAVLELHPTVRDLFAVWATETAEMSTRDPRSARSSPRLRRHDGIFTG
jgi:hypothetical protein